MFSIYISMFSIYISSADYCFQIVLGFLSKVCLNPRTRDTNKKGKVYSCKFSQIQILLYLLTINVSMYQQSMSSLTINAQKSNHFMTPRSLSGCKTASLLHHVQQLAQKTAACKKKAKKTLIQTVEFYMGFCQVTFGICSLPYKSFNQNLRKKQKHQ